MDCLFRENSRLPVNSARWILLGFGQTLTCRQLSKNSISCRSVSWCTSLEIPGRSSYKPGRLPYDCHRAILLQLNICKHVANEELHGLPKVSKFSLATDSP